MSKKIVMIQPGKLGDILICAPIAKHYNEMGYEVLWPVFSNFLSTIERFDYVTPIDFGIKFGGKYYSNKRAAFSISSNKIEEIKNLNPEAYSSILIFEQINNFVKNNNLETIDPCFAFPGHENIHNQKKFIDYRNKGISWIQMKYDLCSVPIEKRWNLEFTRDLSKEEELLQIVQKFCSLKNYKTYSIVHNYQNHNCNLISPKNPIEFVKIKEYNIFDWLGVLNSSEEIYCIDSCLANFVETLDCLKEKKKFYLGTEEKHFNNFMKNILKNNWEIL